MVPEYVKQVAKKLKDNQYNAWLVGGSVRDILLGRKPKDYDITTDAVPDQLARLFPKSVLTGARFGTVKVIQEDEFGETHDVEVTTFRSEKDYVGGRWPSHVEFSTHVIDDLKRRDFTINAMAIDLTGSPGILDSVEAYIKKVTKLPNFPDKEIMLLDPFDGQADLAERLIRAVGKPEERFQEDGLRALRACRIASVLGFEIEAYTFDAIKKTLRISAMVSAERVRDELERLVYESPQPSSGIDLMRESGLLKLFLPELVEGYRLEQNKYHVNDVYTHSLKTLDIAPDEVKFAALFHDIGKPRTKQGEHFYSHDRVGAEMTRDILSRLKFPRSFIEETANLVRWHMFYLPSIGSEQNKEEPIKLQKKSRNAAFKSGLSDAAIRRMIRRVGGHEQMDKLITLRIADATANPKSSFNPSEIQTLADRVASIREEESAFHLSDLKVNGHDLKQIGIPQGSRIRETLEYLLELVTDDITLNDKEVLIELAKRHT